MINLKLAKDLQEASIMVEGVTDKVKAYFNLSTIELKVVVGNKVYYEGYTNTNLFIVLEVDVNSLDTFGLSVENPSWVHIGVIQDRK